jgi:hypothetical protein
MTAKKRIVWFADERRVIKRLGKNAHLRTSFCSLSSQRRDLRKVNTDASAAWKRGGIVRLSRRRVYAVCTNTYVCVYKIDLPQDAIRMTSNKPHLRVPLAPNPVQTTRRRYKLTGLMLPEIYYLMCPHWIAKNILNQRLYKQLRVLTYWNSIIILCFLLEINFDSLKCLVGCSLILNEDEISHASHYKSGSKQ